MLQVKYNGKMRVYDDQLRPTEQKLAPEEFEKIKKITAVGQEVKAQVWMKGLGF